MDGLPIFGPLDQDTVVGYNWTDQLQRQTLSDHVVLPVAILFPSRRGTYDDVDNNNNERVG